MLRQFDDEYRWGWNQYFGPPSTDGAWFELYRKMLIHEIDEGTLLVGQAAPRAWLEDGKRIEVQRAPTYFGPLDFRIRASANELRAEVEFGSKLRPATLLVRLRHSQQKPLRSVTLNGRAWTEFDSAKEWIRIESPRASHYEIVGKY